MRKLQEADRAVLMAAFARMDVPALAVAMGSVFALALFMMTAVVILKGAPPGQPVGPHLGLLANYLPGYSVSWSGAIAGAACAWAGGAVLGFVWAVLWNLSHLLYVALVLIRSQWWEIMSG